MKRLFFFFVFSLTVFAQIDPNQFPKIGFADLYFLQCAPFYYNQVNGIVHYENQHYYYPKLQELGLTHVVTMASGFNSGIGPLSPLHNTTIKVIDNDFHAFGYNNYTYYKPGYNLPGIARATGNDPLFYAYDCGGDGVADPGNKDHNFGFGGEYDTGNKWKYSFWLKNRDNTIGDANRDDLGSTIKTFYAGVNEHSAGYILHGEFHPLHQNTRHGGTSYTLKIRARINQIQGGNPNDIVATVYFSQGYTESYPVVTKRLLSDDRPEPPETDILTPPYNIRASAFTGNGYVDINIPFIKNHNNDYWPEMRMKIDIEWKDTRDLYIDNISIYTPYYDTLFLSSQSVQDQIRNSIRTKLTTNFNDRKQNPLWAHPYLDEAMPPTYRCASIVSNISQEPNILGSGKYVTGANNTPWFTKDEIRWAYSVNRVPYVLYDDYAIEGDVDSVSVNPPPGKKTIQSSWDRLIEFDRGSNPVNGQNINGFKHCIAIANNYTPDIVTDDIPFYYTMQSCAHKELVLGNINQVYYREPSTPEIYAQGFLAMCYGAKGLMYFTIMTNTPSSSSSGEAYYGLFESEGQDSGAVQDPVLNQVTNYRFDAVKTLNQEIDKISSDLLQLTWMDAFSIHKETERTRLYTNTFIKDLISVWPAPEGPVVPDALNKSFVEVGVFKKTSDFTNANLDYFMVMNRRCLSDEGRSIKIKIHKDNSIFRNWKITDIATGNTWVIDNSNNSNSYFKFYLNPGCGKLFRLEPVMLAGGNIAYNENVPSGTTLDIKGTIIVNAGTTLTLNSNSTFNFHSYKSLINNGNLVANMCTINFFGSSALGSIEAPSDWGIRLEKNSTSSISNIEINDARTGIFVNEANIASISNCLIRNSIYSGIAVYRSNYSSSQPIIFENLIINTLNRGNYGISLTYSSPNITNNVIYNFDKGIYCINNSSPNLGSWGVQGNNTITGNVTGIYAYANSNPDLGSSISNFGGNNAIRDNSAHNIYAYSMCNIMAENNWWGSNPPNVSLFFAGGKSSIDYTPWMINPPTESLLEKNDLEKEKSLEISSGNIGVVEKDPPVINIMENILLAKRYIDEGKYLRSLNICRNIINEFPDTSLAFTALDILWEAGRNLSVPELKTILRYIYNNGNQRPLFANAGSLLAGYLNTHTLLLDSIISRHSGQPIVETLLLNKFLHQYYDLGDTVLAKMTLNNLDLLFPESESSLHAHLVLGDEITNQLNKQSFASNTILVPSRYELYNCFPNPFNPTTTIKYDLPVDALVTLEVFDLLGRKIETLINENKVAGSYQKQFDASSLASGVYIYKLQAGSFVASKKMILVK